MSRLCFRESFRRSVLWSIWRVCVREVRRMVASPIYLLCIVGVPLFITIFFLTMLQKGLPEHIPIAVVDMDNSELSRSLVRNLAAQQAVDITLRANSFWEARDAMQRGAIYGFLFIPLRFEQRVLDAQQPELAFYTNDAYLIPGSLLYKRFKTVSVLASAAVAQEVLFSLGLTEQRIMALLQPIVISSHPLGNPWLDYSVYLNNSFIPTVVQLMVLLVTTFAICSELKYNTKRSWLQAAQGSAVWAVVGKLLTHLFLFVVVGLLLLSMLYGYSHFPLNSSFVRMAMAMILLIMAAQSVVVVIVALSPSISIAYSAASVVGVVSFSLGGFSFPVSDMYLPFHWLTNLLPVRHYFLIYVNNALNGYPLYYCRQEYAALLLFLLAACMAMPRLIRLLRR